MNALEGAVCSHCPHYHTGKCNMKLVACGIRDGIRSEVLTITERAYAHVHPGESVRRMLDAMDKGGIE